MEDTLISFETAKLAKEVGFNWTTNYTYDVERTDTIPVRTNYNANIDSKVGNVSAPTQSLLQKWLRETQNIEVFVTPLISGKFNIDFDNRQYDINVIPKNHRYSYKKHISTYEEALEIGLQKALNLIKNKVNTQ